MKASLLAATFLVGSALTAPAQAQISAQTTGAGSTSDASQTNATPTSGTSVTAAPADQAAAPPGQSTTGIADIVVTAQRRSESAQRAAIAVSVLGGAAITDAGVTKPTDLTLVVPAVQIAPAAGPYSTFYLRGVGNFAANPLSDPAVAINEDGVYVARGSGANGLFYDLDRVEVVKGPQGTLYGRNATGGAINVITRRPELGVTGGDATFEYGNYNAVHADAALNLPLGDIAALRVAGKYVRHDGYLKDGTDDQDDAGGRASLLVKPNDDLTIRLTGEYFQQRGKGGGITTEGTGLNNRYGFLSAQSNAFITKQPNTLLGNYFSAFNFAPFMRNEYWNVNATVDYRTPVGTITVIGAHREDTLNYLSATPSFYFRAYQKDHENSLEARVASDDTHPFRYLAGLFYYEDGATLPLYVVNQQTNFNSQQFTTSTNSMAVFGRLTYAVVPSIRFSASGRYTGEKKTFAGVLLGDAKVCTRPTTYFPTYVPGCPTATGFPYVNTTPAPNFNPFVDGTLTIPNVLDSSAGRRANYDKFTYRLSADWDVTPSNLLYASYETGYKSGGFFFSADSGAFRPETISAWTVGSKNRFFGNKVQINLEGFYWRYHDQQISHTAQDSKGNVIFATENVGRATFKGVEAEFQFLPVRNTLLSADLQYLDATYDQFVYTTPNSNGGVSNGTSCPNNGAPGVFYTVNCSGKRPPNAPEWTLNLGAQQTIPFGDNRLVVNVRGHYQTTTLTGLEFTPIEYQHAYWIADAQAMFYFDHDRFSIGAFGNNMFDATVKSFSVPVPFSFINGSVLRPPATYGVRAGIKF